MESIEKLLKWVALIAFSFWLACTFLEGELTFYQTMMGLLLIQITASVT